MPTLTSLLGDTIDHSGGWDWENKHVSQSYDSAADNKGGDGKDISIHDIVESGTVLICAGPAELASTNGVDNPSGTRIVPIGLVETAQINMNKPLSRIFEIGSKLSYIIPGRTVGGIALNRVFFDGPSLLKVLYAGEIKHDAADTVNKYARFQSNPKIGGDPTKNDAFAHIGSGNIAMNLASSFFEQPIGLAFYFRDQQNDTVGQIYFEGCSVSTYNMGISANMNVLTESVNMEFIRVVPIVTQASNRDGPNVLVDKNIVTPESAAPPTA